MIVINPACQTCNGSGVSDSGACECVRYPRITCKRCDGMGWIENELHNGCTTTRLCRCYRRQAHQREHPMTPSVRGGLAHRARKHSREVKHV